MTLDFVKSVEEKYWVTEAKYRAYRETIDKNWQKKWQKLIKIEKWKCRSIETVKIAIQNDMCGIHLH